MAVPSTSSRLARIALLIVALAPSAQSEPPAGAVEMVDASHVRLLSGSPFYDRQELHRTGYVGQLDPDRLLFPYRKLAGLPQSAGITAGYEGCDSGFIKRHMAGHYLSAASRMAAATGDDSFHTKAAYLFAELAKCQLALNQDGYLAAFSSLALVNGVVVATQTLEGRQPGKAIEVACPLPAESLTGQQNLTVRLQGTGKGRVGGLLGLRLESTRP